MREGGGGGGVGGGGGGGRMGKERHDAWPPENWGIHIGKEESLHFLREVARTCHGVVFRGCHSNANRP